MSAASQLLIRKGHHMSVHTVRNASQYAYGSPAEIWDEMTLYDAFHSPVQVFIFKDGSLLAIDAGDGATLLGDKDYQHLRIGNGLSALDPKQERAYRYTWRFVAQKEVDVMMAVMAVRLGMSYIDGKLIP